MVCHIGKLPDRCMCLAWIGNACPSHGKQQQPIIVIALFALCALIVQMEFPMFPLSLTLPCPPHPRQSGWRKVVILIVNG